MSRLQKTMAAEVCPTTPSEGSRIHGISIYNSNIVALQNPCRPSGILESDTMAATAKRPELIDLARGLNGTPWCEEYEFMISGMM